MASYRVQNKSNTTISWIELQDRPTFGLSEVKWFSGELPPGESRTVNSGDRSAPGEGTIYLPGPGSANWTMLRPDADASVTMYGGGKEWGRVWIQRGKTLEVYGEKDWWLK